MRRPWHRWGVLAYDRLYRRLHGLDRPGSDVGPVVRIEVRRSPWARRLPEGTLVGRGDRIGILHLNNHRISALRESGSSPIAVGLEVRRELVASLRALAILARPGGPLRDVRAFMATTVFHQGLERLGFRPEPGARVYLLLVAAYQRALLASLDTAATPRSDPAISRRARRLWMSREALLARYGHASVPAPLP
jgi:hypothetical protein